MPRFKNKYGEGSVQRKLVRAVFQVVDRYREEIAIPSKVEGITIEGAPGIALGSDGYDHPIEVNNDGELRVVLSERYATLMLNELMKIRFLLENLIDEPAPELMIGKE